MKKKIPKATILSILTIKLPNSYSKMYILNSKPSRTIIAEIQHHPENPISSRLSSVNRPHSSSKRNM